MAYPPQRPPLESYVSMDDSLAHGHAPLLRPAHSNSNTNANTAYPEMPTPQPLAAGGSGSGSGSASPGGSVHKLRKPTPGWGKKDAEMGHYEELPTPHVHVRAPGSGGRGGAFSLSGPVVSNPEGGEQPRTKVRPRSPSPPPSPRARVRLWRAALGFRLA